MLSLIIHWFIVAASVVLAAKILPGVQVTGWKPAFIAAAVLGLLNLLVKPVFVILTLPLTVLTFGLFLFVVNALVVGLTSYLVPGFHIKGFWAAVFAAILISLFTWIGDSLTHRGVQRDTYDWPSDDEGTTPPPQKA